VSPLDTLVDALVASVRAQAVADWATAYGNAEPDPKAPGVVVTARKALVDYVRGLEAQVDTWDRLALEADVEAAQAPSVDPADVQRVVARAERLAQNAQVSGMVDHAVAMASAMAGHAGVRSQECWECGILPGILDTVEVWVRAFLAPDTTTAQVQFHLGCYKGCQECHVVEGHLLWCSQRREA
jgi:predicted hotdog family 3-hydroxylacyl-ACP dehydratase